MSQTGEASVPLRTSLGANYAGLKLAQPKLPILIREASGVPPSVTARFEKGREIKTSLEGLDNKGIQESLSSLFKN